MKNNIQNNNYQLQTTNYKPESGFVTLLAVLIVGAVAAAVTVSLLILGTGASKTSFALEESKQARVYAESCANNALEKIRKDNNYTGSGELNFDYGTCTFQIIDLGGSSRQINSIGTKNDIIRKNKAIISALSPKITVSSWQEVTDF